MKVEVIAIGDELLIGQTVNTNASWIGSQFALCGAHVNYGTTIKDTEEDIIGALDTAFGRVDVIIMTGGLGPTKDDITKATLCKYFNTELEINQEILDSVRTFFEVRGRKMLDINIQQAALPKAAKPLQNELGTAPGMWFEKEGKVLVSLPGVPYEMKHLMGERVIPRLAEKYEMKAIYHRTLYTQGIGESYLAEQIEEIEDEIRASGISLAYLPSPGLVRLRLTSDRTKKNQEMIEGFLDRISERLPQYVYSREKGELSAVIGKLLISEQKTVGTVESCTGGKLASEFVSISGSSSYFMGSVVSYSNEIKEDVVGVDSDMLITHGAVSQQVVEQMAAKGRVRLGVDYCLATSGVAGPTGGSLEKPVGMVWIGLATEDHVYSRCFQFGNSRDRNIRSAVLTAMNLLRCELLGINIEKSS